MTEVVIDGEIKALISAIEAVTDPGEFTAVMSALECVLARRIRREQGVGAHPNYNAIAGQMVNRHITALLGCEGLLDG